MLVLQEMRRTQLGYPEDPNKIRTSFTDSAYDTWYLDFIRDIHGVDLMSMNPPPSPPPRAYQWKAS